jgi:hypothetical protein
MVFILTNVLETVLRITALVYTAVELRLGDAVDSKVRDKLNVAALTVDNSIIEIVTGLLVFSWTSKSAKIELQSNGTISFEAESNETNYVQSQSVAATPSPSIKQAVWVTQLTGQLFKLGSILTEAATTIKGFENEKNEEELPEEL